MQYHLYFKIWRKNIVGLFFIVFFFSGLVCPLFFRLVLLGIRAIVYGWLSLPKPLSNFYLYCNISLFLHIQDLCLDIIHPLINIIPISLHNSLSLDNSLPNIINKLLPLPLPLLPLIPNPLLHIFTAT